ncbi:hypothetical protein PAP18089_01555 [Pandoraea apista]|uniref:Uncharacterized protein n=1 Tax=Pandoraea apista TaxID=93218 RepID=A0A5E5P334_9BURK|nr:hypothetical protein LMG16407_03620 [Pandoraea apista]VVG70593.1 hypothetical protein PAP18089_01555 [Pandoraea apista]
MGVCGWFGWLDWMEWFSLPDELGLFDWPV